jgi:uncharacterized protein (DUF362 family)
MSRKAPDGEGTRREFLASSARIAAGMAGLMAPTIGGRRGPTLLAALDPRALVGMARDPAVVGRDGRIVPAGVAALLDRALVRALAAPSALEGLGRLFGPADTVGIKVNCLAGRGLSTHLELVEAIIALLVKAGVPADHVLVWDRSDRDLRRARYPLRRSGDGPLFLGTNDDYENEPIDAGSVGGCLSRILTRRITAVINVPILKDHDLAGISGALKSFYGAIHNPNKYHDDNCSPFVADLAAHPVVRSKTRLTIYDALVAQFQGGPAYVPEYGWPLGAVFASTDPVAGDAVALDLITRKRREVGLESLEKAGRPARWLREAAKRGLGIDDLGRIDRLGAWT